MWFSVICFYETRSPEGGLFFFFFLLNKKVVRAPENYVYYNINIIIFILENVFNRYISDLSKKNTVKTQKQESSTLDWGGGWQRLIRLHRCDCCCPRVPLIFTKNKQLSANTRPRGCQNVRPPLPHSYANRTHAKMAGRSRPPTEMTNQKKNDRKRKN